MATFPRADRRMNRTTHPRREWDAGRRSIRRCRTVLGLVALAAIFAEGIVLSGSRLWAATDSQGYVKLAVAIAERGDLAHPYLQFRPPGYPLLLAAVFRVFGLASPGVILALQHVMVASTAVFSAAIAWTLWPRSSFALLAGLVGTASPYLAGYANTVLTEVPYAFVLTACVLCMLRYGAGGGWRWLAAASGTAGLCAIIKATGQVMPILCVAVALNRFRRDRRRRETQGIVDFVRSGALAAFASVGPAAAVLLPVILNNHRIGGRYELTCAAGMELYQRAVAVERLDSDSSRSLAQLRDALEEAKERGVVAPSVGLDDKFAVNDAYQAVRGVSMAEAAAVMGRAARDLIRENPWVILRRGAKYTYRALMMPDPYYRVIPGAQPADMFDVRAAHDDVAAIVGVEAMNRYLPFDPRPTHTSPELSRITRWYHGHIDAGPPILGVVDTPYEAFAWLCVLGGALSLVRADRGSWMVPGLVVCWHIVLSSFLIGADPRYAIPVHPLLHVFGAFAAVALLGISVALAHAGLSRLVLRRAPA